MAWDDMTDNELKKEREEIRRAMAHDHAERKKRLSEMSDVQLRRYMQRVKDENDGDLNDPEYYMARSILAGRASARKRVSRAKRKRPYVGHSTKLLVHISTELKTELLDASDSLNMSMSEFVRMAIENEIDEMERD